MKKNLKSKNWNKIEVKWYAQGMDLITNIRDVCYILPNGDTLEITYKPNGNTPLGLERDLTINVISKNIKP